MKIAMVDLAVGLKYQNIYIKRAKCLETHNGVVLNDRVLVSHAELNHIAGRLQRELNFAQYCVGMLKVYWNRLIVSFR